MHFDHSESAYLSQLQKKHHKTLEDFSGFGVKAIEVFPSPATAYRFRAEFGIWHHDCELHYFMRDAQDKSKVILIDQFPVAADIIQRLMPKLLECVASNQQLSHKLFQIEFLATLSGQLLVTLIYHKRLDDEWRSHAEALAKALGIGLIGRARKQKVVVGEDFVIERMIIKGRTYSYQQIEASFTQPNPKVCKAMITWALDKSEDLGGDLLELYCGNGNFTIPLAKNFSRVLATEISKSSISAASKNSDLNDTHNIQFVRMSSEEFVQAWRGARPFRRLRDIDLALYQFSTLFVDPPRAGLDHATRELATQFSNILYISCNPETLKRDLLEISDSHNVAAAALFDQFPYTPHRECGVLLKKKSVPQ